MVAATPGAVSGAPTFDVPASMTGSISVEPFPATANANDKDGPQTSASGKIGSRLHYADLTAGQFSQLGDIISSALSSGATVDLSATRSGDVVRMRGGAALTGLQPDIYYLSVTVEFGGPVVATNGSQAGESTVTWTPAPGQNADFNADAQYPDPATAALPGWSWFLTLLCVAIVGAVGALAYRFRDRTPRYTPPAPARKHPARRATSASATAAGLLHTGVGRLRGLRSGDDTDAATEDNAPDSRPAANATDDDPSNDVSEPTAQRPARSDTTGTN